MCAAPNATRNESTARADRAGSTPYSPASGFFPTAAQIAIFVFALASLLAVDAFRHPAPTFDRFLYAAVAGKHEPIREPYPHTPFSDFLASHPEKIPQQFPLYATKPLYVELVTFGARYISPLSLMLLAFWLWWFTRSPWCVALLLAPPTYEAARMMTPDMLSAAMMVGGVLCVLKRKDALGYGLLAASIWARPENVLWLGMLIAYEWWAERLPIKYAAALLTLALASFAVLGSFALPWRLFLEHSLNGGLVAPLEHPAYVSAGTYFGRLAGATKGTIVMLAPWSLLGWFAWKKYASVVTMCYLFAFGRLLLLPIVESRYLLPGLLLLGALAVAQSNERQ